MPHLKVYREGNEIEDLCIAYGLCKIFNDEFKAQGEGKITLIQKKSYYLIEVDDFDVEDMIFSPLKFEDAYTSNTTWNKNEIENNLKAINEFFEENIERVIKYYMTHDERLLRGLKKVGAIGIGTHHFSKSVRASTSPGSLRIFPHERYLATVGYLFSTAYVSCKDSEVNALLFPKYINKIRRPAELEYIDKKEDVKKINTRLSRAPVIEGAARIYLKTLIDYEYVRDRYEKIKFMQLTPAGNKPMADIVYDVPIKKWSKELCEGFEVDLWHRSSTIDKKQALAVFVLDSRYTNFSKLIKIYALNDGLINTKYKEDLINMYKADVREIFNNPNIQRLGRCLNLLFSQSKTKGYGFTVQALLNGASNERHVTRAIREIVTSYHKGFGRTALSNDELLDVINLMKNKKDAMVIVDAILAYGKVFYKSKKENYDIDDDSSEEIEKEEQ